MFNLDLTVQAPDPKTCLNSLNLDFTVQVPSLPQQFLYLYKKLLPHLDTFKLIHYDARIWHSKHAVGIQMKYIIFSLNI